MQENNPAEKKSDIPQSQNTTPPNQSTAMPDKNNGQPTGNSAVTPTATTPTSSKVESVTPPTIIVSPPPPPPTKETTNKKGSFPLSILILFMLIIGIALGVFLVKEFPQFNTPSKINVSNTLTGNTSQALAIPKNAVQIETCEDTKGSLFVEPQNIPQGPIYMSYKGQVVGVEYMLNLNQIMSNGKFDSLAAKNVKIDHVKFGYLSEGHQGNPVPHFHADLYTVPQSVEENIKCPPGQSQQMNMPGMDMYESSGSATISPSAGSAKMPLNPSGTMQQMQMNSTSPTMMQMH